ncbi:hypothetical protein LOK49_LG04G00216 [Camellia lanceoleosa]|uniref:Uncharacterized protein n=1 Tax=Camellia lanceoleosa TaxID=1840588 RepID=A0ACC0HWU6_9ERIC|nr:hypothetical protein LOK49_LG04G00216 [Camellia lanceoleosa]
MNLVFYFRPMQQKQLMLLNEGDQEVLSQVVNLDGSRWWKETGVDERPDGVDCGVLHLEMFLRNDPCSTHINDLPMDESQAPGDTLLARQDLNESTLDLSLGFKDHDGHPDSDVKTDRIVARQALDMGTTISGLLFVIRINNYNRQSLNWNIICKPPFPYHV